MQSASADGGRRGPIVTLGLCVFSDQTTHTHDKHVRMYRVGLRVFLRACPLRMYVQGGLWVFLLACPLRMYVQGGLWVFLLACPLRMYVWSFTYMSCLCHVVSCSFTCHVHVMLMSCPCHLHVTFMTRSCYVSIMTRTASIFMFMSPS